VSDAASSLVTIMFTDLVGSTELLSRAGDEDAQRIFRAHHDLLAEVVGAHRGEEVKWLGDGLMVAFPSAADAVRAAVAMQQASRRTVQGERLAIRVGLNAGETLRDAADWFGTPVVVARRLCDRADAGQIICSAVVASLLEGRGEFAFSDLGELDLKGVPKPIAALTVVHEIDTGAAGLATAVPCVGREAELRRLTARLAEAAAARGGVALVAGEPGIGKTRLVTELAGRAERDGALVLWGHCYEGDWTPPYAPFAEALDAYVTMASPDQLRADLSTAGGVLAQLVPALRTVLPDLPEAVPLPPDEERFRLFEAATEFLLRCSERRPLLLCLDDLHWADKGSVGMLRHLARQVVRRRVLVAGTYRDAEVGDGHPLADALGAFPRETTFEKIRLEGLGAEATAALLGAFGDQEVEDRVGAAWSKETAGNPFFIAELARYLTEEGLLYRAADGRWTTDRPLAELPLPDSVRDVVARRMARLGDGARKLLSVASAFEGPFRFEVVASVADLSEDDALDAVDEALAARALDPAGPTDTYLFHHALIRHTLYEQLSPSRTVRLHRRVAEALEAAGASQLDPADAGEIAVQWHRSAGLPGAERGVEAALAAADHAQTRGGHDEAVRFLRIALDLLPDDDERRPRLLGRLGIVLAWALDFAAAGRVATEAGDAIAEAEDKAAAAEYLADATYVCGIAGGSVTAWELAGQGLAYCSTRDVTWARLLSYDYERRAAEDASHPGIPLDTQERRESARILRQARLDPLGPGPMEAVFDSRQEAFESNNLMVLTAWAGEYVRTSTLLAAEAREAESAGRFFRAARAWVMAAHCQASLGQVQEARQSIEWARSLAARAGTTVPHLLVAQWTLAAVLDKGWDEVRPVFEALTASKRPEHAWFRGYAVSALATMAARDGEAAAALPYFDELVPWLASAPTWTVGFTVVACDAAETLWFLDLTRHADVVDRALHRLGQADFRYPAHDWRLATARLRALTGHHDEARSWFAEARRVLAEQGARPLSAIVDHDEALMYARREEPGDGDRAQPLVAAARRQFEELGMTGWIRRADELATRLG
jgi:class 3 adenylate cyclase